MKDHFKLLILLLAILIIGVKFKEHWRSSYYYYDDYYHMKSYPRRYAPKFWPGHWSNVNN